MKFGVCIPHYGIPLDVDNLTGMAIKAEEMGFDRFGLRTISSFLTKFLTGPT